MFLKKGRISRRVGDEKRKEADTPYALCFNNTIANQAPKIIYWPYPKFGMVYSVNGVFYIHRCGLKILDLSVLFISVRRNASYSHLV